MRKIEAILLAVIILGCTAKEEHLKTFTARQVTEDNDFSYGSVQVKINPKLNYTDSPKKEIYLFDYDRTTGEISNQGVFFNVPAGEGVPDGMTVDADGYIWTARWDGGCLVRIAPDGIEDFRISFPAKKVSSVTFGGKEYKDIYVSTAGGDNREEEGSGAGALFHMNLDIQGLPEFFSRINPKD